MNPLKITIRIENSFNWKNEIKKLDYYGSIRYYQVSIEIKK